MTWSPWEMFFVSVVSCICSQTTFQEVPITFETWCNGIEISHPFRILKGIWDYPHLQNDIKSQVSPQAELQLWIFNHGYSHNHVSVI